MFHLNHYLTKIFPPQTKKNKGQTFIEFVFLLLTVMLMSTAVLRGMSYGYGKYWRDMVGHIVAPTVVNW